MTTPRPEQPMPPTPKATGDAGFAGDDIGSIEWSSDRHIRIVWTSTPSLERIISAAQAVRDAAPAQLEDVVHSYRVVTATVAPHVVHDATLAVKLLEHVRSAVLRGSGSIDTSVITPREFVIPVAYTGPDLRDVAQHRGCAVDEVVRRHTAPEYAVRFIGFTPGFAYLEGLDPSLHTPRLSTPRREVQAGSVGIAGQQTGVYPQKSPGGWRIIGTTATVLFDPVNMPDGLLRPGDRVRFRDVTPGGAL